MYPAGGICRNYWALYGPWRSYGWYNPWRGLGEAELSSWTKSRRRGFLGLFGKTNIFITAWGKWYKLTNISFSQKWVETNHQLVNLFFWRCSNSSIIFSNPQLWMWMFPKNRGTPKSSILIGFSIKNHPFWGTTIFGNTHVHTFFFWISISQSSWADAQGDQTDYGEYNLLGWELPGTPNNHL